MLKVFAVLDVKVSAFLTPIFFPTTPAALRAFGSAAQNAEHDFFKFPEDYIIYEIGTYDPSTAVLTSLPTPLVLAKALDFQVKN